MSNEVSYLTPSFDDIDNEIIEKKVNEWVRIGISVAVSAALHPFDYSKTLMQLGYEPIPAVPGKSLLGKPIMLLPNIFQYTAHIRKVDGLWGCYRGIAPKIIGFALTKICSKQLDNQWAAEENSKIKSDTIAIKKDSYQEFKNKLKRELVVCVTGVIVFQPFHVVSVRMMAEFVGRETLYTSLFDAVNEIFQTEGFLGFFAGLMPRIISDVGCLILTSSTVFLLNKYVIKDRIGRQYNAGLAQFAYSNILYPFQVVSTCMCVTGSRLSAGQPPHMPIYSNWLDCMLDLKANRDLKRGSSLILRSTTKLLYTKDRHMNPVAAISKYKSTS